MTVILIDDPDDPRVAAFRDIRERDLTGREGLFIAEGEVVVRTLLSPASRCRARAMLLAQGRVGAQGALIEAAGQGAPVYAAAQAVLDRIAGFDLHRGILALGEKPALPPASSMLADLPSAALVLVASGIGNHDNMGGLFRNAAAFGADAVLLDDRCCDPFYRKAIRVSVGAVLRTPMPAPEPVGDLIGALEDAGFEIVALTPSAGEALGSVRRAGRQALLVGSEGPGLPAEIIARCRAVGIRMHGGFDSLNVAVTGAIALHHLTTQQA